MRGKIKTSGDLRNFLSLAMEDLRAGMLDPDVASKLTKMAGQVNESFYAEIKTARVMAEFGRASHELGELPIGKGGGLIEE